METFRSTTDSYHFLLIPFWTEVDLNMTLTVKFKVKYKVTAVLIMQFLAAFVP